MRTHIFALAAVLGLATTLSAGELDREFKGSDIKVQATAPLAAPASASEAAARTELDDESPTQAGFRHAGWGGGAGWHGRGWGWGGWSGHRWGWGGWGWGRGWGWGGWGWGGWGLAGWGQPFYTLSPSWGFVVVRRPGWGFVSW